MKQDLVPATSDDLELEADRLLSDNGLRPDGSPKLQGHQKSDAVISPKHKSWSLMADKLTDEKLNLRVYHWF